MAGWGRLLGALIATAAAIGQAAGDEAAWRVDEAGFECIVRHLDAYSKSQHEPVIIIVPACPEVDPQVALASIAKNSILPAVVKPAGDGEGDVAQRKDQIITVPKQALACLGKSTPQGSGDVLIPKDLRC
jgi:hypothetical protein